MTGLDLAWCFLIVFVLYVLIAGAARPSSASGRSSRSGPRSGRSTRRRRPRTSSSVAEPTPAAPPDPSRSRAPGSTVTSPPTGPGSMSRRRARRRAAGAAAARLPASSGGPGAHQLPALAAAGYRAVAMDLRGYGGSDKTPRRLRPGHPRPGRRRRRQGARRPQRGAGRPRLGRVRRAGRPPSLHPREVSALCAVSAPHPLAMLRALRPGRGLARCGTCWRCSCRWLPERRLADPRQRLPARPPARLERSRLGVPGRRRPSRRTSGRSACGRPRTARWSTTAGCSAPGCAPTGGGSAG